MGNISTIFKIFAVISLFSIKMFAAQQSCPRKCLAKINPACPTTAGLSALCLATSASTLCASIYTAQSVATCLQVAPIQEVLVGACATCVCAYATLGVAIELKDHMPACCRCGRSGKRLAGAGVDRPVALATAPAQQTMGLVHSERKLQ